MDEQMSVTRRAVSITDATVDGLLSVQVSISRRPPPGWSLLFDDPSGIRIDANREKPVVDHWTQVIHFRCSDRDGELEDYVREIEARIEWANENLMPEVAQDVPRQMKRAPVGKAPSGDRLDAARQRATQL